MSLSTRSCKSVGILNNQEIRIAADPDQLPRDRNVTDPIHPATIVGTGFSSRALIAAFLRYGNTPRYALFASPHRVGPVRQSLAPLVKSLPNHKRVEIHDSRVLLEGVDNFGITTWYDPFADIWRGAYVRSNFSQRLFPIVGTIHTISYQSMLRRFFPSILLSDTHPCDSIVCTSTAAAKAFRALGEKVAGDFAQEYGLSLKYRGRLDVIPLGVDIEVFRPRDKRLVRTTLSLPLDALIILYVGRFSIADKMDLFPLLRVFTECCLSNRHNNLLLVLAGSEREGNLKSVIIECQRLGIQERVRIITAPFSTAWLYSAADIFVSPADNIQESFGNTIAEALASGLPTVASDWNGYRDIVEHGKTGFTVPTYWSQSDDDLSVLSPLIFDDTLFDHCCVAQSVSIDLQQFKKYLLMLIDNESLREEMSKRSRERAECLYSWPVVVARYEKLWDELLTDVETLPYIPGNLRALYAQPRYFDAFSGYATHLLTGESRLRLTSSGVQALETSSIIADHHLAIQIAALDVQLLYVAATSLMKVVQTNTVYSDHGVEMDVILYYVQSSKRWHPHVIRRHLQWLLKYGYAEVVSV
jgi:D-inositol-3-phosphate glycosyltransferase